MRNTVLSVGLSLLAACTSEVEPSGPALMDPTQAHFGSTYGEWGGRWWSWVYAFPYSRLPFVVDDCTTEGQPAEPLFFLAGTDGTAATTRSCSLNRDRALFFPLVNAAFIPCWDGEAGGAGGCDENGDAAGRAYTEGLFGPLPDVARVIVDGNELALGDLRALRGGANFSLHPPAMPDRPEDNYCLGRVPDAAMPCGATAGSTRIAWSDGYWVMLAPLARGTHSLRIYAGFGAGTPGEFMVDATYELQVE